VASLAGPCGNGMGSRSDALRLRFFRATFGRHCQVALHAAWVGSVAFQPQLKLFCYSQTGITLRTLCLQVERCCGITGSRQSGFLSPSPNRGAAAVLLPPSPTSDAPGWGGDLRSAATARAWRWSFWGLSRRCWLRPSASFFFFFSCWN